ncbi:MAG: OmpW family outer membrane protein [Paracoccaceae bacterium]|nr:OmpW family outer membrane protein [Paracoccaceae bacterium]
MKHTSLALALLATLTCATGPALAQSAGDFTLGFGIGLIEPRSDNGSLAGGTLDAEVDSGLRPTFTAEYFIRDDLGIEVLASLPFLHDINIDGLGQVGTTWHLPPTVSLQYHFNSAGTISPFLGAGLNYTIFFNEGTRGALAADKLKLDNSFGVALHAGFDYKISDHGALRADVRYIDIDTDVKLNGTKIGTVNIDPVVFGVAYIHRF